MSCTRRTTPYSAGVISMHHPTRLLAALGVLLLAALPAFATPDQWAGEISQFGAVDAAHPPATNAVVFVGSSSIRFWTTLAKDFPGVSAINRGFGGSELADTVYYADRIIIPYSPRLVVVCAGENDLAAGRQPEAILADFQMLRAKIHAALPTTRIIFLAIKESPSRANIRAQVLLTNRLLALDCLSDPLCRFVDVATPLLDAAGHTRPELFREDQLHLLPAGYAIWTQTLAPYLYL